MSPNTNTPQPHPHEKLSPSSPTQTSPSPSPAITPPQLPPLPPCSSASSLPSVYCSSPLIDNGTPHLIHPHHLFCGRGAGSRRYYGRDYGIEGEGGGGDVTPASSPPPLISTSGCEEKGKGEGGLSGGGGGGGGGGGSNDGEATPSPSPSPSYPLPILPLPTATSTTKTPTPPTSTPTSTNSLPFRSRTRGTLLSERIAGYEGLGSGQRQLPPQVQPQPQPQLCREKAKESVTPEESEREQSPLDSFFTAVGETEDTSSAAAAASPFDAFFASASATTGCKRETRKTDYSRTLSGSPGRERGSSPTLGLHVPDISLPKRRLPLARFGYTGEEEDKMEKTDDAFVPEPSESRIDTSKLLDCERTELEGTTSLDSFDLHMAPTEAEEEEEARRFWDGVMDDVNAAGDRVLRDDEDNPDYPCVNSSFCHFYASGIPARDVHSEPNGDLPQLEGEEPREPSEDFLKFSERKEGREDVLQVFLSRHPTDESSKAYFDRTGLLNNEANRRALCMDDPDTPAMLSPDHPEIEDVEMPLHKSLKSQLPSSHTFTATTYRSKYHRIQDIEAASAYPGVALRDYTLKARADQYGENKKILESSVAPERERNASSGAPVASKCRCNDDVTTPEGRPGLHVEHSRTCKVRAEDELHFTILRQWELARDIERLGAVKRNVESARTRLRQHPLFSNYSVYRKRFVRRPYSMSEEEPFALETESAGALVDSIPPGVQLRRSRFYDNLSLEYVIAGSGSGVATQTSSNGDPFPHDSDNLAIDLVSEVQPAVRSDAAPRNDEIKSRTGPSKSGSAALEDGRNRAAAQDIIRSLGTVSRSIHKREDSLRRGSSENGWGRTERGGEQTRRDGSVSTSLAGHDERYPKRLNIVQR